MSDDHDIYNHVDKASVIITPIVQLAPAVAKGVTDAVKVRVQKLHADPENLEPNKNGHTIAQKFEEGDVAMAVPPGKGFSADMYLMDFYDGRVRDICARMHMHTGERFVTIYTGPETEIVIASMSRMTLNGAAPESQYESTVPGSEGKVQSFNYRVPENSVVAVQIPTMVSHSFNAIGPNAVILSTHIEELVELDREKLVQPDMNKQTIFLQNVNPNMVECGIPENIQKRIESLAAGMLIEQNVKGFLSAHQIAERFEKEGGKVDARVINSAMDEMHSNGVNGIIKARPSTNIASLFAHESCLGDIKNHIS